MINMGENWIIQWIINKAMRASQKESWICVHQRVTDGDITVICHRWQDEGLRDSKEGKEEELSHTPCIGDDVLRWDKTHQHFGSDNSGIAEIYEGQVIEEKVRGGVQVRVESSQGYQAQVPHHSDHVET